MPIGPGMWGYPRVVMFKEKVYIGGGRTSSYRDGLKVMVYDPKQDSWDSLPPYTYRYFPMAAVGDQLVLVGGREVERHQNKTNKLGVWNEQSKRWTHPLPPMITACSTPSVATHNNRWLVVMGGDGISSDFSRLRSWTLLSQYSGTKLHRYLSHVIKYHWLQSTTCVISWVASARMHPKRYSA